MNEYDRQVDIMTNLCKFCPVCGKELQKVKAQAEIKNSGIQDGVVSWYNKQCPDGHGSFGVDYRWDPRDGQLDAVFEFDPNLFKICGHCNESMKGYASWGDTWLCHPDEGLDCYRLVTVYHHPRDAAGNCERCQRLKIEDKLRGLNKDPNNPPTFFEQLREVQAIVDEANRKVDE